MEVIPQVSVLEASDIHVLFADIVVFEFVKSNRAVKYFCLPPFGGNILQRHAKELLHERCITQDVELIASTVEELLFEMSKRRDLGVARLLLFVFRLNLMLELGGNLDLQAAKMNVPV